MCIAYIHSQLSISHGLWVQLVGATVYKVLWQNAILWRHMWFFCTRITIDSCQEKWRNRLKMDVEANSKPMHSKWTPENPPATRDCLLGGSRNVQQKENSATVLKTLLIQDVLVRLTWQTTVQVCWTVNKLSSTITFPCQISAEFAQNYPQIITNWLRTWILLVSFYISSYFVFFSMDYRLSNLCMISFHLQTFQSLSSIDNMQSYRPLILLELSFVDLSTFDKYSNMSSGNNSSFSRILNREQNGVIQPILTGKRPS